MQRTKLSAPWQEMLHLDDGREMLLRPISPLDAEPLRAGFALLDPEEVRMRFLHPMKEMSEELAHRLTNLDDRTEFALVAAEPAPPGEALVGAVARCSIDEDNAAEFAILVARMLTGQGLGRYMMKRLISWARRKRLSAIYGNVMASNSAMLTLATELGFDRHPQQDNPGMQRVRLELCKPKASHG